MHLSKLELLNEWSYLFGNVKVRVFKNITRKQTSEQVHKIISLI